MKQLRALIAWWAASSPVLRASAAVAWTALIWWWSSQPAAPPAPGSWRPFLHNGAHVVAYAVLGALVFLALHRARCAPARLAAALAALYGVVDELHQSYVPTRVASVGDVLSDLCGAVLGVALAAWLLRGESRAARVALAAIPIAIVCVGVETFRE